MKTGKKTKCVRCGSIVETRWEDVMINTTTVFSPWRVDEIADCRECGHKEIIEKDVK